MKVIFEMIIRSKINFGCLLASKTAGFSRKLYYFVRPTHLGISALALRLKDIKAEVENKIKRLKRSGLKSKLRVPSS